MIQILDENRNFGAKAKIVKCPRKDYRAKLDVLSHLGWSTVIALEILVFSFLMCDIMGIFKKVPEAYEKHQKDCPPADPVANRFDIFMVLFFSLLVCSMMNFAIVFLCIVIPCKMSFGKPKPMKLVHLHTPHKATENVYDSIEDVKKRIEAVQAKIKDDFLKNNP